MGEFQRISDYRRLVCAYFEAARSGWKTRDEPAGFLRGIEDLGNTILCFGTEAEKECLYALLDEEGMSSSIASKILSHPGAPDRIREKALDVVRKDVMSGALL